MHAQCINRPGFTLIEILVAIFIFSVLFTVLFGSFRTLSSSSDALGRGSVQFEMGRSCISRISSDIEATYVSLPPFFKQADLRETADPYRWVGKSENVDGETFSHLRFTSLSHFSFGMMRNQGVAEIVYYVDRLEDGRYVLRRSDSLYPYEEFERKSTDPVVCTDIQAFSIAYFDEDVEETEEWDSESGEFDYATPRSVRVDLQIGEEETPTLFSTRIYIPAYREKPVSMR
jgi:general secretion pathway protein J